MIEQRQNQILKRRGQRKTLLLHREQLLEKALNPTYDVVLIMAPIGYGKKTLMNQLEERSTQPIVLKLGVDDSNPFSLINHIRAQLEVVIDFEIPVFDPSVATVNHLISVIEALDRTDKDLQFFFHGSQVLSESSAQLLERFMVKLPQGHRVFISGFNISNLELTEVYFSARVLKLESADLLLSLEEIKTMLDLFESGLDAQMVFEKSGGIISLVFVMVNTNSLEVVSFEKFIENILNTVPKPDFEILKKFSVFDVWNLETATALQLELPESWFEKILTYGLPITVSVDNNLLPHETLKLLLLEHLKLNINIFKQINKYAAEWYFSNNLDIKGIQYLVSINEFRLAEEYLIKLGNNCIDSGEYGILFDTFSLFENHKLKNETEIIQISAFTQFGLFKKAKKIIVKLSKVIKINNLLYENLFYVKINYLQHNSKFEELIVLIVENLKIFKKLNISSRKIYYCIFYYSLKLEKYTKFFNSITEFRQNFDTKNDIDFKYYNIQYLNSQFDYYDGERESIKLNLISKNMNQIDYKSTSFSLLSIYSLLDNNFEKSIMEVSQAYEISSYNRPYNSINILGTYIDILILFEKFDEAQIFINEALAKCERFDVTYTTFKLQEYDYKLHLRKYSLAKYELEVNKLPILDLTDQRTIELHKARIAFIQKDYQKTIAFALQAIQDSWIPTKTRAWAFLIAAYYWLGDTELTNALQTFNKQLSAFGTLRIFTLDWQYLEATFEALRDESLLVDVKWTHGSSESLRPKLEIATLGRYRVVLDGELLDLPDDAIELLAYLALYREKSIEEMLNDFGGLDLGLSERAKLKKRLEYRFTILRDKFWACKQHLVASKNEFFSFDKKTGRYCFGHLFSLRFDAKKCQVINGETLVELYKGRFLHKSESVWVASVADNFEKRFTTAAHEYATTLSAKDAIRVLEKILSMNETDETAWQNLIQNYVLDGQEQQAQWTFKRWEKVAFDFGFDPPSFNFSNPAQTQNQPSSSLDF